MAKWQIIALIVTIVAIFGGMTLENIYRSNADIEKVKAGLEECPRSLDSRFVIWIKDCSAYTKLLLDEEKRKDIDE